MKKIYSLLFVAFSYVAFAQTFYSENMGTPTSTTLITAYTGWQNAAPIAYAGTGDVRTSTASNGYNGASGGGNVFLTSTSAPRTLEISGLNTAAYVQANIQLSFGYLTNSTAIQLVVEASTDGTTWTPLTFTQNANTSWNLVTISGQVPSSATLSLRFSQPSTAQMRIDDVKLSNVNASCTLTLGTATTACTASTLNLDPYTVTIPYTGGGNATYVITPSSGTVSGGNNPSTVAAGDIIISGVTEGTNFSVTITGGTCNFTVNGSSPECKPINTLPLTDSFPYTIGSSLNAAQKWTVDNSGDNILINSGSLNYPGITSTGNSITFTGTGAESRTPFTNTTTGSIYASFIATVSDFAGVVTDLNNTYFATFTTSGGAVTNARIWIRKNGTQYQYGLGTGSAPTDWGTGLYNLNDVQYIVLGYDFATNLLTLNINPTIGGNSTPAVSVTPTAAFTGFGGFLFRQDSDTTTPTMIIDELRIAETANFTLSSSSFGNIAGLKVYPNPVSNGRLFIETAANAERTIAIYDILGKNVLNTTTSTSEVNVASLKGGVYIVKITEEGNTTSRKLIIR